MFKFEYNYQEDKVSAVKQKTLFIQQLGQPRQPITKTFTTNWGSPGFILEPDNHWITFTHYPNKITTFYKEVREEADPSPESWPANLSWKDWQVSADTLTPFTQKITYFQKDLPKTNPLIFTFTPQDQVQKIDGVWVKKLK